MSNETRFSVPVPLGLKDALEAHRLRPPGVKPESDSVLCNRMLERLQEAIEQKKSPKQPSRSEEGSPTAKTYSFRARKALMPFLEHWRKTWHIPEGRYAALLAPLLEWACKLPVLQPIADAQELYEVLLETYDSNEMIPAAEILDDLQFRCHPQACKAWLLELEKQSKIILRYPTPNLLKSFPRKVSGIQFAWEEDGEERSKTVAFVEFIHGYSTLNFAYLRELLFVEPVEVNFESDEELIEYFLSDKTPQTQYNYRPIIKDFLKDKSLKDITQVDFDSFVAEVESKDVKDERKIYMQAVAQSLLKLAFESGYSSFKLPGQKMAEDRKSELIELRDQLLSGEVVVVMMDRSKVGYLMSEAAALRCSIGKSIRLDAANLQQARFYKEFLVACRQLDSQIDAAWLSLRDQRKTVLGLVSPRLFPTR